MQKLLVLIAVAVAVSLRLTDHTWNAVPVGALALYAGATLPRRWAWCVPILLMIVTDIKLDYGTGRAILDPSRLFIYASYGLITLMGPAANLPKVGAFLLPLLSVSASGLFFLLSNFGAWLVPELNYPMTWEGLVLCYTNAVPFYRGTFQADLIGTVALFGAGFVLERAAHLIAARKSGIEPQAAA